MRGFEIGGREAVASKLQYSSVRRVTNKNVAVAIGHSRKRTRCLLPSIRQNPPNPQNLSVPVQDLHSCACRIRHIDPSIRLHAEGKRALTIALSGHAQT